MNIYVGNLPYSITREELEQEFSTFGEVSSARIVNDRESGRSKGFGFVEMNNDDEARRAIDELNGKELGGRKAVVNEAKPREERPPRRDGGFNRGGGERRSGGFNRGGNGGGRSW
ncbi:RNA-binding protein [Victivallis sp. Marseille-Q1083]|uniref:RNA recognition motif domain-containing protein n=1 Tax=Victivallis sp. Marseille-Q1083 TaxID=2717288 RepID=UPI00158EA206|nr:RNA-binding protein [Victivallis sp. Marseille-Q1083]